MSRRRIILLLIGNGIFGLIALTLAIIFPFVSRIFLEYRVAFTLAMAIAAGIETLKAYKLWLALQRLDSGHCASCGYDLRATPHRCPECGTIPVNAPITRD